MTDTVYILLIRSVYDNQYLIHSVYRTREAVENCRKFLDGYDSFILEKTILD